MPYLIFAVAAATCFALNQLINKFLSKHSIDNQDSLMAYFMLASFTFALFLLPFISFTLPSINVLKLISIATATFLIGFYLFYGGIFTADVSTFSPLFQLQAALIALLAFIFLKEKFPLLNYLWMLIMVLGAVLVTYTEKMTLKKFLNKGILLIILMQVMHAISNIFIGFALKQITAVNLLFWENILIGIFFFIFVILKKPKLNYSPKQIAPMFFSSFIVGIGVIFLFKAFSYNLTISSVVALLSAPIVFVVSLLASSFSPQLLEHHNSKVYIVRGLGLATILFGAWQLILA